MQTTNHACVMQLGCHLEALKKEKKGKEKNIVAPLELHIPDKA